jgi:hypothetical protein
LFKEKQDRNFVSFCGSAHQEKDCKKTVLLSVWTNIPANYKLRKRKTFDLLIPQVKLTEKEALFFCKN